MAFYRLKKRLNNLAIKILEYYSYFELSYVKSNHSL